MSNMIYLVGRIVNDPTIKKDEKYIEVTIAVARSFKNEEGVYETDLIPVVMWKGIADNVCEYCHKGDLIGIKGRIERLENEELRLVADKVSFLAPARRDEK